MSLFFIAQTMPVVFKLGKGSEPGGSPSFSQRPHAPHPHPGDRKSHRRGQGGGTLLASPKSLWMDTAGQSPLVTPGSSVPPRKHIRGHRIQARCPHEASSFVPRGCVKEAEGLTQGQKPRHVPGLSRCVQHLSSWGTQLSPQGRWSSCRH